MTLDYKRFRTAQLAQFARNRNLDVKVRPRQERGCYLRALIDADNDATFRFLDLPAEMRNNVYEHLLTLRNLNHGWRCYPEILATCKQANREAREYLMTGNHSKIHAVLNLSLPDPLSRPPYKEQCIFANGQQLNCNGDLVFRWPSVLLDSQYIDISIAIQQGPPLYPDRWPYDALTSDIVVNRAIYDLYYALQDGGRKPSVNFTIYVSPGGAKTPNFARLLSPIAMFDGPKSFELSKVHRRKRRAIKSSATAKMEHSCNENQVKRFQDVSQAIWEIDSLRSTLNEACGLMTMARERRLSSAIDDLEAQVTHVYFAQHEPRMQQLAEQNRALAKDWAKRMGKA
ncbi:hypothetical protein D0864_02477 [Hortaea werneckii]|uniref:Uncharacterized protein n=1 Tax=Hortaea werneckii TaxID=91943 RepID=A0A3M7GWQ0_HORWE|nr:hypothetical protein D0864_02477 [Hortaea werneckii]